MSVVVSGTVTQSAAGTVLTFTDTTTGIGTLVSRTLQIYDPNGNLLAQYSMGANLSQTYDISQDQWLSFVETIVDNTGTYVLTVNYLSTAFYQNQFVTAMAAQTCPDNDFYGVMFNLGVAQDNYAAALRAFIGGFGVLAQALITQANFYVQTPYYA